jgi:hypothetical protein
MDLNRSNAEDVVIVARRRVRRKVGLAWHALVFVLANGAMAAINHVTSPQYLWFAWPLAAWGAALLLHAFATFGTTGMVEDLQAREVERELARRAAR